MSKVLELGYFWSEVRTGGGPSRLNIWPVEHFSQVHPSPLAVCQTQVKLNVGRRADGLADPIGWGLILEPKEG